MTTSTNKPQYLLTEKDVKELDKLVKHGWFIKLKAGYRYVRFKINHI
jgi:hypothetical protein